MPALRRHQRAAIKDIHRPVKLEAFPLQQLVGAHAVRVAAANHFARFRRQEVHIDRIARHQVDDELVVRRRRQLVRVREIHPEEVPPQAFPERRRTLIIDNAAQLRQHLVAEAFRRRRHQQVARLRGQPPRSAAAVIRLQEQRADFREADIFIRQHQRVHVEPQVARRMARLRQRDDAVVEEGLVDPRPRFHRRTPDDLAGLHVFHHHQVFAELQVALPAVEGAVGFLQPLPQDRFIHRQAGKSGSGQFRQLGQRVQIIQPRGTHHIGRRHGQRPIRSLMRRPSSRPSASRFRISADSSARSGKLSVMTNSSFE